MSTLAQKIASEICDGVYHDNLFRYRTQAESDIRIAASIISKAIEPLERRIERLEVVASAADSFVNGKLCSAYGDMREALHALKEGGGL